MIKMSLKAQYKDKPNSDVFDVNSKYLHKKFKKMAETVPVREKLGAQGDDATAKEVLTETVDKEINRLSINSQSRIGAVRNDLDVLPIGVGTHDGKIASSGGTNVADVDAASRHQNVCVQCKFESANYSFPHKCTHIHARELPYPSSPSRLPVRDGFYLSVPRGSQDHAALNQKERGASVHISSVFENKASKHNGGQPSAAYSSHRDGSRETLTPSTSHEMNNNQGCPKQIYKPKFKVTLQYEEGEMEYASEMKSSTCQPLSHTIVESPLSSLDSVTSMSYRSPSVVGSERSPHQNTKHDNDEVNVDGNNSVITKNYYRRCQRDLSVSQHSSYISIASHFVKPHLPLGTSTLVPVTGDQLHRLPLHSIPQRSSQAKLSVAFGPLEVDAVSLHSAQPLNLSAPSSLYEKTETASSSVDVFHRKRSHAEELPLAFKYEYKKNLTHGNASVTALEKIEKVHPYNGESGKLLSSLKNPERFTIKDLLLKTGGKVQAVGVMQGNRKDVVSIGEIISDSGDALVTDFSATSPNKLQCYICAVCKCAFETAASLTIHQQLYCIQKQLLYSGDVRNLHHSLNRDCVNSYNSLSSVPAALSKDAQTLVMHVGNTAVTSSASSLSSPGPVLGNTLLVAKGGHLKQAEVNLEELEEKQHNAVTLSKRRRLDSDLPVSQVVRSMGPILTVTDISDSISSLRNLEESQKFPAHQNRRVFGEVQTLGGAGKTTPLLGNTSAKPLGCAADMIHRIPSHVRPNSFPISSSAANEIGEDVSRHVIVSSESHSDSAVIRVAHESLGSTSTNLSPGSVIKSLHVPGGNVAVGVHQRSKSSSPVRKPSQNMVGSGVSNTPPPPFSYSSATLLSPSAALNMNSPNSATKHLVPSLPSISLPNLPTAKIPVRTLSHQLPYMPFLLGLSDLAVVSSLNPTIGGSPQSAQEAASCNKMSGSVVQQDSSGALTIVHKGKSIPYVPGMPGPQSLILSSPVQTPGREEIFSEPLDLAFPPKDDGVQYFLPKHGKLDDVSNSKYNPKIEESPAVYQTERYVESNAAAENKTYVSSEQKATALVKPLARVEPRILSSMAAGMESKRAVLTLSSLVQGTSVIQTSDSNKPVLYDAPTHKSTKTGKPAKYQPIFHSGGSDDAKEDIASRQDAPREEKQREVKTESGSSDKNAAVAIKFHRPNSLPLKPETFVPRKHFQFGSTPGGSVVLQVSPETPRSRKSFGQLYLQGNVFTFLNLKISTRPFFCILTRTQPMYVVQTPENPKLSMYSNWRIKRTACPNPLGLSTTEALAFYDSRNRCSTYTTAKSEDKEKMIYTHSSYWLSREYSRTERNRTSRPDWEKSSNGNKRREEHVKTAESETSSGEPPPRKAKIFGRGFESKEDYTYVKGRGRGRYVCNDCGIRCLKPSMLRNHIRTHTNIRPYICRHCNFSFKTKGNLTKHMKSKAHYKKCIKLCIFPVPTVVDDSYIDEECFAQQQAAQQGESGDTDSDENEDDEDEEDDDKESEEVSNDCLEQEVAHSLLSLSEPVVPYSTPALPPPSSGLAPASSYTGRPSTYPYTLTAQQGGSGASPGALQSPGLAPVCAQMERETVLRNTSLAVELGGRRGDRRKDERREMSTMVYRRDDAAPFTHIPRLQSDVDKYRGAGGRAATPHEGKCSVDGRSTTDKGSDADDEYGSSISCSEDDSETSGRKEKHNLDVDAYSSASVPQPIDLSTKNPSHPRGTLSSASFPVTSAFVTRMHSASVTEIFAPLPGPATVVASPNSSVDHGPFQGSMFDIQLQASADSSETNILHKYLTKREAQNAKLYQHDDSVPMETSAVPKLSRASPMTAADSMSGEHQPKETDPAHQFRPSTKHSSENNVACEDSADADAGFGKVQAAHESPRGSVDTSAAPVQSRCSENADGAGSRDLDKQKTKTADDAATEVPSSNCDNTAKNAMISRLGFSGHSWVPSLPAVSNAAEPEAKAEFLPPSSRPLPSYVRVMKDGQSMCIICNKVFSKPSQLRLHVNIHCLEHPFKCELCAVSFRKKGHLKKHETSVSHQNRVGTTAAVCTLTTTNPRPFKCDDCNIAFRIHGHLAKHLRSKMHIMKLECIGKLPFGTYEEMEREGFDPYDIDTTDCENSLESLQVLAQRLHRKDPSKLGHWGGGEVDSFHPNCPSPAAVAQRAREAGGCSQAAEAGAGDCCSSQQDPVDASRRVAAVQEFSVPPSPVCHAPHMM